MATAYLSAKRRRATVAFGAELRLIDALVAAGSTRIEITSLVSPKWTPPLADADEVAEHAHATHSKSDHGQRAEPPRGASVRAPVANT